jgi:serine/threonine-protein kinase RsbW
MSASRQHRVTKLAIEARAEQVRHASLWLAQSATASGVPDDELHRLDLCLNEALANIISHGSPDALTSPIHLLLEVHRDGEACEATVTVSDAGPAFDTSVDTAKPRPKTLADAEPGGLGLLMIRSFADHLAYSYHEGRNHLSFSVRWVQPA